MKGREEKLLVWIKGEIKTPPFGKEARIEAGCLLRDLQVRTPDPCHRLGDDVTSCG